MYFWNYKKLAQDLRERKLSRRQINIYIVIFITQFLAIIWLYNPMHLPLTMWNQLTYCFLPPLFLFIWLGSAYMENRKGDGQHFFERLACIDLPVTVRVLVLGCVLGFMAGFAQGVFGGIQGLTQEELDAQLAQGSVWEVILSLIAYAYYYYATIAAFRIAAGR